MTMTNLPRNSEPTEFESPDPWETGELGRSLEHAVSSPPEESRAVDEALGLQLISIRLQKSLIATLKQIAAYHGIGYQPMIRDLLNRFAASEIQQILQTQLIEAQRRAEAFDEETTAVSEFLERERHRA